MRLIDADALVEYCLNQRTKTVDCNDIARFPLVDAVVRCKDCVYWQDNNGGYPHPECRWGNEETPDPYDYCSFAERRNQDETD